MHRKGSTKFNILNCSSITTKLKEDEGSLQKWFERNFKACPFFQFPRSLKILMNIVYNERAFTLHSLTTWYLFVVDLHAYGSMKFQGSHRHKKKHWSNIFCIMSWCKLFFDVLQQKSCILRKAAKYRPVRVSAYVLVYIKIAGYKIL